MPSKTFYASNIAETSCSSCRDWSNKSNLKQAEGYAQCGTGNSDSTVIAGKNGTHKKPSALTLTNFKVKIPTGAMITNIKVEYVHQKVAYKNAVPNIPAPTISLVGISGHSTTGSAPTTTRSEKSVSFNFKPDTSKITSSNFGVKINYPANKNTNLGYLRLWSVRVIVTYTEAKYSVGISKADTAAKSVGDTINLNVNINNKNKVNYNPKVTISLPSGVSYNGKVSGNGAFSKSESNIIWNPNLSSSKVASTAVIKLKLSSTGSKKVTIKENVTNDSASVSFNVAQKSADTSTSDVTKTPGLPNPKGTLDTTGTGEAPSDPSSGDSGIDLSNTLKVYEDQTLTIDVIIPDKTNEWLHAFPGTYIYFKIIRDDTDITTKFVVGDLNLNELKLYANDFVDNCYSLKIIPQRGSASLKSCKLIAKYWFADYEVVFG